MANLSTHTVHRLTGWWVIFGFLGHSRRVRITIRSHDSCVWMVFTTSWSTERDLILQLKLKCQSLNDISTNFSNINIIQNIAVPISEWSFKTQKNFPVHSTFQIQTFKNQQFINRSIRKSISKLINQMQNTNKYKSYNGYNKSFQIFSIIVYIFRYIKVLFITVLLLKM